MRDFDNIVRNGGHEYDESTTGNFASVTICSEIAGIQNKIPQNITMRDILILFSSLREKVCF